MADPAPISDPAGDGAATARPPFADAFSALGANVRRAVRGKPEAIDLVLLSLFAEGHVLVEDTPGVGKTSLAKAIAASIEAPVHRIQFTPDLLPSDVVGVTTWDRERSQFSFRPGPVFATIVLADEINRAAPRTQSALLECMAERQVTVDGATHGLGRPFLVIATQNPHEHEGTYPLPESQLDRFLVRLDIGYPDTESELEILATHGTGDPLTELRPVVTATQVAAMADAAMGTHVAEGVARYLVALAEATRAHPQVAVGVSPRGTLGLQRVARVRAAAAGRDHVTPDDIKALAPPVWAHRLVLADDARYGRVEPRAVLAEVLAQVPAPRPSPA